MTICDTYKQLILTDYIDGEMDAQSRRLLEAHLHGCASCRELELDVRQQAVAPFVSVRPLPVPPGLWDEIRPNLEARQQPKRLKQWLQLAQGVFVFPRLVPVLASLMVMVVAGSAALHTVQVRQAQDTEGGKYLVSVFGGDNAVVSGNDTGLGTPIEEYFL